MAKPKPITPKTKPIIATVLNLADLIPMTAVMIVIILTKNPQHGSIHAHKLSNPKIRDVIAKTSFVLLTCTGGVESLITADLTSASDITSGLSFFVAGFDFAT